MNEDLRKRAAAWLEAGNRVAVATIVRIRGSSSQPLGARMIMTTGNRFLGAVSGDAARSPGGERRPRPGHVLRPEPAAQPRTGSRRSHAIR